MKLVFCVIWLVAAKISSCEEIIEKKPVIVVDPPPRPEPKPLPTCCPKNEIYIDCGTAPNPCQFSCDNTKRVCTRLLIKCPKKCFCIEGFIRQYAGGPCIPLDCCPPKKDECDCRRGKCDKYWTQRVPTENLTS